jgi:hypothetical protein
MQRAILLALTLGSGCAIGRIEADGSLHGVAMGRARIERCLWDLTPIHPPWAPREPLCDRIEGGSLSAGAVDWGTALINGVVTLLSVGVIP